MGEFQFRHGSAASAASANPVLDVAEPGYITDTGVLKIGDGVTPLNALAPWTPNAIKGAPRRVNIADKGSGSALAEFATTGVGTSQIFYTVGIAATDISFKFTNWHTDLVSSVLFDLAGAGSITFNASVRVVSTTNPGTTVSTTPWPITFKGASSVTLAPGGQIVSDTLGISLNPGDVIAVRTFLSAGTAAIYRLSTGWAGSVDGFTATTDLTLSTTAIAQSTGYYYCPSEVLGFVDDSSQGSSFYQIGDSIGYGTGDSGIEFSDPALYPGGFVRRALTGSAGLINASIGGDLLTWFQATNGSLYRLTAAADADAGYIEYGTNDFTLGVTAATVEAALLDVATKFRRMGLDPVYVQTITPRTTSTDNWATVTNQTPISGNAQRVIHNTWLRAGCPIDPTALTPVAVGTPGALLNGQYGHPITAVFDAAAVVESSLNSGLWLPALYVTTGSMTSGTNTLTAPSGTFGSAIQELGGALGGNFCLAGAGAAGVPLAGYITTVASSTSVSTTPGASTTVSNAALVIGASTNEGVHPSPHNHYLLSLALQAFLAA